MIKLETHAHCKGGSCCGTVDVAVMSREYKEKGYGGIVLTNHFAANCFAEYPGDTPREKLDFYFSLFHSLKSCATPLGLKIFFGAEVRAVTPNGYSEYMLLGISEKFLSDNIDLFQHTQEEIFRIADNNGVFMSQTHPFRRGVTAGNPKFMHGAEVFNGHFGHYPHNNNDIALRFAEENGLKMLAGSDYHDAGQPITAGIMLPETVNTDAELAEFLFSTQPQLIRDYDFFAAR